MTDTIFALSSGRPPAAISIIRISGSRAHEAGECIAGPLASARMASLRELRCPQKGELLDVAVVVRFDGPASSTGEDIVELQCHGGRAVVDSIGAALCRLEGVREARPGEFTRRAFDNGRIDLTEAEGLADLIEAETEGQRKAALLLAEGGLRRQIAIWQGQLLDLVARSERAIDYDDDDLPLEAALLADCDRLALELMQWVERPRVEPLKNGLQVVVAGPPNAGKSSLINAIAGEEKAIVTDIPGTTRDSIEVPTAIDGVPIRLTDTAGLRDVEDPVEAIGVDRAGKLIAAADILLWLGEPSDAPAHPQLIKLLPKADLLNSDAFDPDVLPVSARTCAGISSLLQRVALLARSVLPPHDALALNRRQASHIEEAAEALAAAARAEEVVFVAENLRFARTAFDRLTGRAGVEQVLDTLFDRFCLGK